MIRGMVGIRLKNLASLSIASSISAAGWQLAFEREDRGGGQERKRDERELHQRRAAPAGIPTGSIR